MMKLSYKPSDDSFLLFDAVRTLKADVAIDVGTGSGFIALGISVNCGFVIGTDIDFNSILEAKNAVRERKMYNVDFIVCDLLSAVKNDSVDLIVFNPPYLPNDEYKTDIDHQTLQYHGGDDVIARFVYDARRAIKSNGSCYMVFSSLSNIDRAMLIAKKLFSNVEIVAEKSFFFEKLYVAKFSLFL